MLKSFFKTFFITLAIGGVALLMAATVSSFIAPTKVQLVNQTAKSIVYLTPPDLHTSGGTGFLVNTHSGNTYTLTNAHICRLAIDGYLDASQDTNKYTRIRVLEISQNYDLCLLEKVPGISPLSLSTKLSVNDELNVIGHPLLQYMTLSQGYVTNFENVTILLSINKDPQECEAAVGNYVQQDTPFGVMSFCVKKYDAARTTCVVYPGNSGSPTVDAYGYVVGVLFAANGRTNYGYVEPIQHIINFLSIY